MYPKVCVKKGQEQVGLTSPWYYDNQLDWRDDTAENGCIVDVIDHTGRFLARGFFNENSKITVRIITRSEADVINDGFIRNRILAADAMRTGMGFRDSYRVVFGDSDGLPGLTVDKFGSCLSFQIASLGMEQFKQCIIDTLAKHFSPAGIMERNDIPVRLKEGLPLFKGCVYGAIPEALIIYENDVKMYVDLFNGQKTGYFLDQQLNRKKLQQYVSGKSVLDLCCCNGGFSIHAAHFGASSVTAVDVSQTALDNARQNMELNGLTGISFRKADIFELLRCYAASEQKFDIVVLDPPAFAKTKQNSANAYRGYKEVNLQALRIVEKGGFFLTFSCSQPMTPDLFYRMVQEAARDSGRQLILKEALFQSPDHPICATNDQSLYLKGFIYQVF